MPYQKDKANASGTSPRNAFLIPTSVSTTGRDFSIRVRRELVEHLREAYGGDEGHETAFQFVSREFQAEADNAWVALGRPSVMLATAWDVFTAVADHISTERATNR
jgi:hypothetical protein